MHPQSPLRKPHTSNSSQYARRAALRPDREPRFIDPFERDVVYSQLWLPSTRLDELHDEYERKLDEALEQKIAEGEATERTEVDEERSEPGADTPAKLPSDTAGGVMIFDVHAVGARLKAEGRLPERSRSHALHATLCRMRDRGPHRRLTPVTPAKIKRIGALRARFPNFGEFLDKVCMHLRLAMIGRPPAIRLPRILLVGSPGIGKTVVIHQVARILGVPTRFVAGTELTAGFVLSGMSEQWANARHGIVAEVLLESEVANPLVILDELDKLNRDSRWPADGPLYRLLEPHTAKSFRDEHLNIDIDASRILWLATANELHSIPAPILSRVDVVHAADPTVDQMGAIADSVNEGLFAEYPAIRRAFLPELTDEVKRALRTKAPRTIKSLLLTGYARAIERGRKGRRFSLLPEDIPHERGESSRPIGFAP